MPAAPFVVASFSGKEVRPVTEKQKKFADEYIIDSNATRAYLAAYPAVKNSAVARAAGARLLAKVSVRAYIDERLEELHNERTATAQEVLEYLTSVLRGESKSEVVVVEGAGDGYSEARTMLKNPDEKDRLKAAELLGKRFGLYTDKMQISGMDAEKSKLDALIADMIGGDQDE